MDQGIAALASRQHGVVGARQLLELGLGRGGLRRRVESGRLNRLFRGAYAVGHEAVSREGRWLAAVISVGPGAALSHRSAAALWGLRSYSGAIELTIPRERAKRSGMRLYLSSLPLDERGNEDAIPVTSVPRTILDLARVLPRRQVELAINQAHVRRLYDRLSLPDLLERYPGRRGTATIRSILADQRLGKDVTDSELEEDFLAFCERTGLPRPETQLHIEVGGRLIRCDAVWRAQRVIVELDGHSSHSTRDAFESDRSRDRRLNALGWRPLRVTWRHLHRETDALEADLLSLLSLPSAPEPGGRLS